MCIGGVIGSAVEGGRREGCESLLASSVNLKNDILERLEVFVRLWIRDSPFAHSDVMGLSILCQFLLS